MSNRSMLEFNHDNAPTESQLVEWARQMSSYFASGNPACLPDGVTWFGMRHHTTPCPLDPPLGWDNRRKT